MTTNLGPHKISIPTEFESFRKIPRLSREIVITEKIDGSNAQVFIGESGEFLIGSRNRWITPDADNFGFARWAMEHKEELLKLGPGRHFGEWFGAGIQRGYGLKEKRFALFNVVRWVENRGRVVTTMEKPGVIEQCPGCCTVVPVLYRGPFETDRVEKTLSLLQTTGSLAVPGFSKPEGIVIYHKASGCLFKKTIEDDESPKSVPGLTDPGQLNAGVEAGNQVHLSRLACAGSVNSL